MSLKDRDKKKGQKNYANLLDEREKERERELHWGVTERGFCENVWKECCGKYAWRNNLLSEEVKGGKEKIVYKTLNHLNVGSFFGDAFGVATAAKAVVFFADVEPFFVDDLL